MIRLRIAAALIGASALAGCNLAPHYVRSVADFVPPGWPAGAAYAANAAGRAGMPWRSLVVDAKLRTVIERALANNQDLAQAVANVASARALYRVQKSSQLPTLSADAGATIDRAVTGGGGTSGGTATGGSSTLFSGSVGISGFELDLFGRQKNLSRAAFETYLGTQSGARNTRFTVVAETATAYLTLVSDRDLLAVSYAQVASSERTVKLNDELHDVGLVSGADPADARTLFAQARADVAQYTTQVAQDRNALELLVGAPVEDALLSASLAALDTGIATVPAGLSSTVLLDRPDVVEAEHQLKSANANVGAARAAFFPTISLTSALGVASSALTSLFSGSTLVRLAVRQRADPGRDEPRQPRLRKGAGRLLPRRVSQGGADRVSRRRRRACPPRDDRPTARGAGGSRCGCAEELHGQRGAVPRRYRQFPDRTGCATHALFRTAERHHDGSDRSPEPRDAVSGDRIGRHAVTQLPLGMRGTLVYAGITAAT